MREGQRVYSETHDAEGTVGACVDWSPDSPDGEWEVRLDDGRLVTAHGRDLDKLAGFDPRAALGGVR